VKSQFGDQHTYLIVIGGGSLYLNLSEADWKKQYEKEGPEVGADWKKGRSALGFKKVAGQYFAVLVWHEHCKLKDIRNDLIEQGCYGGIFIDGSGSAQIKCKDEDDNLVVERGSDKNIYLHGRPIWNMIKLVNKQ
jgi:hypothetical protein